MVLQRLVNHYEAKMKEFKGLGFTDGELEEILIGLMVGVDVSQYARFGLNVWQMREIRLGLECELYVDYYSDGEYSDSEDGVYNAYFNEDEMRVLREGLMKGIQIFDYLDITAYDEGDYEELEEALRIIEKYNNKVTEDILVQGAYAGQLEERFQEEIKKLNINKEISKEELEI